MFDHLPKPVRTSRRSWAPALPTISALGYAVESSNAQACRQLLDAGATVGKDVVTGAWPSLLPHAQQAKLEAQTAPAASKRPQHMRL